MLENSGAVRTRGPVGKSGPLERSELANQIQGFRILDRWDVPQKNNKLYFWRQKWQWNQN